MTPGKKALAVEKKVFAASIIMEEKILASKNELEDVKALLNSFNLPTEDIENENIEIHGWYLNGQIMGSGAIESTGTHALLRSIAVSPEQQGKGLGKKILSYLESKLLNRGISDAYIMTEIPSYFERLKYEVKTRKTAPEEIKNTDEFSTLCPDSAVLMKKELK